MSGLLSRWNQRREQVALEKEQEKNAETATVVEESVESEQPVQAESNSPVSDASEEPKILTAEDLPDPEGIEVGGSFASFMADNVDPAAKQAALRALWKQPQYNEIDGLLEYALDYSNQPKLSPDVSAELAKKIFRHVVKDEKEEDEQEQIAQASADDQQDAHSDELLIENEVANETAENAPLTAQASDNHLNTQSENQVERS